MSDPNKELSTGRPGKETSIWKKEISFGDRPTAAQAVAPAAVEATAEAAVDVPAVEAPAPGAVVAAAAEPVVEVAETEVAEVEVAQVEAEPFEEPAEESVARPEPVVVEPEQVVAEAEPVVVEPVPAPAALPVPEPAPEPQPVLETPPPDPAGEAELPAEGDSYGWLTANFEDAGVEQQQAEQAAAAPAPASAQPAAAPEPEPVAEAIVQAEQRVPFWKKDVSLSRKPKAEKPAKQPKESKESKEKGKPFWKKDLSLGKKDAAPKAEQAPKEKGKPFWKKDLAFGKKGDAKKQAKAPKVKGQPFWKMDLSFGRSPDAAKSAPVDRTARKKRKKQMVVGLKVGASQLAAARVVNNGSPELVQVAREPLDDGIIVGGELRDPETLATELAAFFARHKLPKRNVRLGIANNRIGVRTFEITGIEDPRQLSNAIRFRAQETLPIPLEEAVLDWQVLSETRDEEGGITRRVLLVVAYRELVDRYVLACKKAGLRLAGIDLEAFAMLRAVITPPPPEAPDPEGASVVVNVGHDRSTLAVSDGRICEFTRVLSWGGRSLSVAIARVLDMTPTEVEPLKHALVFGGTVEAPELFTQEQTDAASEAATRELQAFARELVSSLRFYQNQPGSLGIGQIVLTGGTSHVPGLAVELERLIGVAVRVGDPLARVKLGKKLKDPEQVGSFAVAVGLGIDD